MKLINPNEALRMIENSRTDNPYFNGKARPIWELAHDCALSCVMACPTVDAVEVAHGQWIERPSNPNQVYCSECTMILETIANAFNYCPNCGAKMDGGVVDATD